MFTGLVEETARVTWLRRSSDRGIQLQVSSERIARGIHTGDSVAVNGCCLTVSAHRSELLTFDLLQETLDRTNLGRLRPDSVVNLERALRADSRLGGHFVQGHVDCSAKVRAWEPQGDDHRLEVDVPAAFSRYVAFKGSIAINGVSLTVADAAADFLTAWIIPHTRKSTNLRTLQAGDMVNLEFDLLAKYVERMMQRG